MNEWKIRQDFEAMTRNVKKLGCVSRDIDSMSKNSVRSILKKGGRSAMSDMQQQLTPVAERSVKILEEKGTSTSLHTL